MKGSEIQELRTVCQIDIHKHYCVNLLKVGCHRFSTNNLDNGSEDAVIRIGVRPCRRCQAENGVIVSE